MISSSEWRTSSRNLSLGARDNNNNIVVEYCMISDVAKNDYESIENTLSAAHSFSDHLHVLSTIQLGLLDQKHPQQQPSTWVVFQIRC